MELLEDRIEERWKKVKMTKYEIRLRAREGSMVGTGVV